MTGINHIVGGSVFTGVFCSLWNLNIFERWEYLVATIVATILPDIDHKKSLIGKIFYPVSHYISRKYGHRTITHSIFFLTIATLITYITIGDIYTYIVFFGVFSHLVFDMLTITGVPLLYPFYKNPCVIPGNDAYRIRTGDIKTEGVFLIGFVCCLIFLQPLFSQGFWTTFRKSIMTDWRYLEESVYKEKKIRNVTYIYNYGIEKTEATGYLIDMKKDHIYLCDELGNTAKYPYRDIMVNSKSIKENSGNYLKTEIQIDTTIQTKDLKNIISKKYWTTLKIGDIQENDFTQQNSQKTTKMPELGSDIKIYDYQEEIEKMEELEETIKELNEKIKATKITEQDPPYIRQKKTKEAINYKKELEKLESQKQKTQIKETITIKGSYIIILFAKK